MIIITFSRLITPDEKIGLKNANKTSTDKWVCKEEFLVYAAPTSSQPKPLQFTDIKKEPSLR